MPLTEKGEKILAAMKEQYGEEEGTRVFYASKNAGTIEGVDGFDPDQPRDDRGEWTSEGVRLATRSGDRSRYRQHAMNPASKVFREHTPDPVVTVRAQRKRRRDDEPITILNKDGHAMIMMFDNGAVELGDADKRRTSDGYLLAWAKVARVGCQKYRGSEVGQPTKDSVILYRPEAEVFHADAMRSMANKPVTLMHPRKMVDATSWSKHAKGFSGTDVVRDGDFVRVPLMLTDADTIRAVEDEGVREMSVGYLADIDWTAGTTPQGEHYDGIQKSIRANHHALVPVARGGRSLKFGDDNMDKCPACGNDDIDEGDQFCSDCGAYLGDDDGAMFDRDFTAEERKRGAKEGWAKPDGSYPIRTPKDLSNAIHAWGRGGATASDKAWIIKRARALGKTSMLPEDWGAKDHEGESTMVKVLVDGLTIDVADEQQATILNRHLAGLAQKLKDAADDDADDEQEREKKERGYKDTIAAKDGEVAALRKQLQDAQFSDEKQDAIIAERMAVVDAAKPLLPHNYNVAGKSLAEIRRAAVAQQMGDAAAKEMDDAAITGAFRAYSVSGSKLNSGARNLADGMTRTFKDGETARHTSQPALNDAAAAYDDYIKNLTTAYKNPPTAVRN